MVVTSASVERVEADGATYVQATLDTDPGLPAGTVVADARLLRPTQTAGLWKLPKLGSDPEALDVSGSATKLVLDGLHRERARRRAV